MVKDDLVLFVYKLESNNSHLTFVSELKTNVNDILDRILLSRGNIYLLNLV